MQKVFSLLLFFLVFNLTYGQSPALVDEMPYFSGCSDLKYGSEEKRQCSNENLVVYIADYLEYPDSARNAGIDGTVYISFVVNQKGEVKEPKVVKDIGFGCGKEALRIVSTMPNWEPGKLKGNPLPVEMSLPIRFSLSGNAGKEYQVYWGGLKEKKVTKKELKQSLTQPIVVRDSKGNDYEVQELIMAYRRKIWKKYDSSRGELTSKMKRMVKWSHKGGELAVVATIQHN
ncbi:MAG: energy transducer TonB, partial [Saprospiraceae bacterium]